MQGSVCERPAQATGPPFPWIGSVPYYKNSLLTSYYFGNTKQSNNFT